MLKIIHIDNDIIVIEKPAGVPTLSSPKGRDDSLAQMLLEKYEELRDIEPRGEAGLIQRLDNDTSGLIIAARNQSSYDALSKASKNGEIKKVYLALVHGLTPQKDVVDKPIAHHPRKKDRMVVCNSAAEKTEWKGRDAKTEFVALSYYKDKIDPTKTYTLLRVTIKKGARHQIRVHLASAGYPLVGDKIYSKKSNPELQRHLLHSYGVCMKHPAAGKELCFISTLPEELIGMIKNKTVYGM
ncbi:MAG: pseudouridine synthase [Pseudomonadota bacterium]